MGQHAHHRGDSVRELDPPLHIFLRLLSLEDRHVSQLHCHTLAFEVLGNRLGLAEVFDTVKGQLVGHLLGIAHFALVICAKIWMFLLR